MASVRQTDQRQGSDRLTDTEYFLNSHRLPDYKGGAHGAQHFCFFLCGECVPFSVVIPFLSLCVFHVLLVCSSEQYLALLLFIVLKIFGPQMFFLLSRVCGWWF